MLKNLVKKFFGSSEAVSTGAETSNVLSLYALQHAEHFKCASSTDESAMFIDLNLYEVWSIILQTIPCNLICIL